MSDFTTQWTAARQASLSFTTSQSLLKLMFIELVMPSSHLVLCCPLFLLPSIFPSIRVFSNESVLSIRWSKYWNFSFSISLSNEHSRLSRVFSNITVHKHQFFGTQASLWSNSHIHTLLLENPTFDYMDLWYDIGRHLTDLMKQEQTILYSP